MWVGEQGRACAEDNWLNGINNLLQSMFIGYLRYAIVSGGVKGQRFVLILSMVLAITAMIYRYWFFLHSKGRAASAQLNDPFWWLLFMSCGSSGGEQGGRRALDGSGNMCWQLQEIKRKVWREKKKLRTISERKEVLLRKLVSPNIKLTSAYIKHN